MRFICLRWLNAALIGVAAVAGLSGLTAHPVRAAHSVRAAAFDTTVAQGRVRVCQPDQRQSSGATYRICMPASHWNGELVVFAHGFVSPTRRVAIPEEQLTLNGISLPTTVTALGYAFAVTSYSVNGLAVKEGVADVVSLVALFKAKYPETGKVYLMGFSEGALITALALEQSSAFDGGLAACGPVGDFAAQIDHVGDFRVVFDYYFPKLLPGSAISVPRTLVGNFDGIFNSRIAPQLIKPTNALSLTQLLNVTGVTVPMTSTLAIKMIFRELLWYNVHSTADGIAKLKGQPFDNARRVYKGSLNDVALNARVQRFAADKAALAQLQIGYTPTGMPQVPLVTLHTIYDTLVPYQQVVLFRQRVVRQGRSAWHINVAAKGYGHCGFSVDDMQLALSQLQERVQE